MKPHDSPFSRPAWRPLAKLERPLIWWGPAQRLCLAPLPGGASQDAVGREGAGPFIVEGRPFLLTGNRHVWIQMPSPGPAALARLETTIHGFKDASLNMMERHTVLLLETKFSFMVMGSRTGFTHCVSS